MGHEVTGVFGRLGLQNPLNRWRRMLQAPGQASPRDLQHVHSEICTMRATVDDLAARAQAELIARVDGVGGVPLPDQCDWVARPSLWRVPMRPRAYVDFESPLEVSGETKIFHDASVADVCLRQDPKSGPFGSAPFALILEVYRFDGGFVSIVQDLPEDGLRNLTLDHVFTVRLQMTQERPVEVYGRLNVQCGPNTEQMVRQFSWEGDWAVAEFDLAYSNIKAKRLEKAWLDLIFEGPKMNRIALNDMLLLRAPRADI